MLVLQRQTNQSIRIGDDIKIVVVEMRGPAVRLGIEAPPEVPVHREEIYLMQQAHGDVHSLADGAPGVVDSPNSPDAAAHHCDTAIALIDQVIDAEGFVGPLCRERLVMAREKIGAARSVLKEHGHDDNNPQQTQETMT